MRYLMLILVLIASPIWAVEPDEVLDDPALEARARDLSQGLRCLVCRNESIDESNADLARDLRILVRERLVAGDSDQEALDFITARYGEYVLLKPQTGGSNLILWLAGPAMALIFGGIALGYIRRRSQETHRPKPLSKAEEKRLQKILKD